MVVLVAVGALLACGAEPVTSVGTPLTEPDPIAVVITSPTAGELIGGVTVRVAGEVSSSSDTLVLVHGEPVPAIAGRFSHWLSVADGERTITVEHPDSGASDSVTITVDALPPALDVTGPPRGTAIAAGSTIVVSFTASDERGLVRVQVGSKLLDAQAGPAFSAQVPLVDGLNTLRIEVEDGAGNVAQEHVSVLSSEFGHPTDELPEAVVVHLGQESIRGFNALASNLVGEMDFTALAQAENPIIDTELATVSVDEVTLGPGTQIAFSAIPGKLAVDLVLYDLVAKSTLQIHTGSGPIYEVGLTLGETHILVGVTITPVGGAFEVGMLKPVFEFAAPSVSVTEDGTTVPSSAGIEGPVLDSLETLLTDTALAQGAELLQFALGKLTEPFTYELAGVEVLLNLTAIAADPGEHGLELRLSGVVSVQGETVVPEDPGVPRTPSPKAAPYHPRGSDATLALSDDLINTVLHAVWRLGGMQIDIDQAMLDELKAPVYLVAGFLGGLTDKLTGSGVSPESSLTVGLSTPLPPILAGVPTSDSIAIAVGDASLDFRAEGQSLVTGYVSLQLGAGAVTGDDGLLLELAPFDTAFDLYTGDPELKRQVEGTVEPFVTTLLSELAPLFSGLIGAVPLPEIGGLHPVELTAGDDGTDGAYLVVRGLLRP